MTGINWKTSLKRFLHWGPLIAIGEWNYLWMLFNLHTEKWGYVCQCKQMFNLSIFVETFQLEIFDFSIWAKQLKFYICRFRCSLGFGEVKNVNKIDTKREFEVPWLVCKQLRRLNSLWSSRKPSDCTKLQMKQFLNRDKGVFF